jgi:ADP-ribosylglycohydrolase
MLGFEKKKLRKQSTKLNFQNETLLSKFEATLLASLIGDCVGRRFEGIWGPDLKEMLSEFKSLKEQSLMNKNSNIIFFEDNEPDYTEPFSDDTALTRAICDSLINREEFDLEDLANTFQATYIKEPYRGYASGAITLFKKMNKLKSTNQLTDSLFMPAMELFNGEGSYGNGGGMRCSPIALFTCTRPLDEMKLMCELSTKLTHTHMWAVIGALQQCYAVRLALISSKSSYTFDFDAFYTNIVEFVVELERSYYRLDQLKYLNMSNYTASIQKNLRLYLQQKYEILNIRDPSISARFDSYDDYFKNLLEQPDNVSTSSKISARSSAVTINNPVNSTTAYSGSPNGIEVNTSYSSLLKKIKKLIAKCRRGERINLQVLYKHVASCGVNSIDSIPMALFAFMIASDPKCANELNMKLNSSDAFNEYHPIERVIFYAISFGGDTDTIASMAGALAGAFFGRKDLPEYLINMCESHREIELYARKLFEKSVKYSENHSGDEENNEVNQSDTNASVELNIKASRESSKAM